MEHQQQKFSMGPMEVRAPKFADADHIRRIPGFKESMRQCIYLSGRTAQSITLDLEIKQPQMSRILSNFGHFPDDKIPDLMEVCQNLAPLQWLARRFGYRLVKIDPKEMEIEELENRLNSLRRSA